MLDFLLFFIALVLVISFHEFSHAWVATRLGDPTAKYQGRLTLNPLKHLDLIGTLMLFLIHIGWGKPVPINPENFNNPKRDSALVALAGPGSNLLIAFAAAIPFKYFSTLAFPAFLTNITAILGQFFGVIFDLSILLAIFNLLPFPPLDGSKVIGIFIPHRYTHTYEKFLQEGMTYFMVFILIDIFFLGRVLGFSIVGFVVGKIFEIVRTIILLGT